MIKVPFLGSYFNTIMPIFILLFGSVFAALSIFKLKSKTLTAIKNFTQKNIVEGGGPGWEKKESDVKKGEEAKNLEEQSIVQRIL